MCGRVSICISRGIPRCPSSYYTALLRGKDKVGRYVQTCPRSREMVVVFFVRRLLLVGFPSSPLLLVLSFFTWGGAEEEGSDRKERRAFFTVTCLFFFPSPFFIRLGDFFTSFFFFSWRLTSCLCLTSVVHSMYLAPIQHPYVRTCMYVYICASTLAYMYVPSTYVHVPVCVCMEAPSG